LLSKFQTGSSRAALFCYQNKKYYFRGVKKICTMAATTTVKTNKTNPKYRIKVLSEFISSRSRRTLKDLKGKISFRDDYDYKLMRS